MLKKSEAMWTHEIQTRSEFVPITEAAHRLGISRSTVYEALARGEIPGLRIGHRWIIPRVRFERLISGESES
jgi:excisionase family DNA binding protein